jgi:Amt family ammonium transporter
LFVRAVVGLRVDEKEEVQGLDIAEHGTRAYGDFRVN